MEMKMVEYQCEECGAVYTIEGNEIPSKMSCICKGRNFKLLLKELQ